MQPRTILILFVFTVGAQASSMDWWGLERFVKAQGFNLGAKHLLQCWALPAVNAVQNKTLIEGMPLDKMFGELTVTMNAGGCNPADIEYYIKDCIANTSVDANAYKTSVKLLMAGTDASEKTIQNGCRKEICEDSMACQQLVAAAYDMQVHQKHGWFNDYNFKIKCGNVDKALTKLKKPQRTSSPNCQMLVKAQLEKERAAGTQAFTDLLNLPGFDQLTNIFSKLSSGATGGSTGGATGGLPTNAGGLDFLTSIFNGGGKRK